MNTEFNIYTFGAAREGSLSKYPPASGHPWHNEAIKVLESLTGTESFLWLRSSHDKMALAAATWVDHSRAYDDRPMPMGAVYVMPLNTADRMKPAMIARCHARLAQFSYQDIIHLQKTPPISQARFLNMFAAPAAGSAAGRIEPHDRLRRDLLLALAHHWFTDETICTVEVSSLQEAYRLLEALPPLFQTVDFYLPRDTLRGSMLQQLNFVTAAQLAEIEAGRVDGLPNTPNLVVSRRRSLREDCLDPRAVELVQRLETGWDTAEQEPFCWCQTPQELLSALRLKQEEAFQPDGFRFPDCPETPGPAAGSFSGAAPAQASAAGPGHGKGKRESSPAHPRRFRLTTAHFVIPALVLGLLSTVLFLFTQCTGFISNVRIAIIVHAPTLAGYGLLLIAAVSITWALTWFFCRRRRKPPKPQK